MIFNTPNNLQFTFFISNFLINHNSSLQVSSFQVFHSLTTLQKMYTPFIILSALAATALAAPITDSSPRGLVDTLTGTAGSVVGGATNAAGDLVGGVTGAAGDLTSSVGLKKERGLLDGATDAVGSVVGGATDAVGDLVGDVGLKERGLVDGLLGGLTGGSSTSSSAGAASTGAASGAGGLLVGCPHLLISLKYVILLIPNRTERNPS